MVLLVVGGFFCSAEEGIVVLEKFLVYRLEWDQPRRLCRKRRETPGARGRQLPNGGQEIETGPCVQK